MKKATRSLVICFVLIIALLASQSGFATSVKTPNVSTAPRSTSTPKDEACSGERYFYQLENSAGDATETVFKLYVERPNEADALLHTGNISLGAEYDISFIPAEGWITEKHDYTQKYASGTAEGGTGSGGETETPGTADDVISTGTTADGKHYISFKWYWTSVVDESGNATAPKSDAANPTRQYIGDVTVSGGSLRADDIVLLPWPETAAGTAQIADLQAAKAMGGIKYTAMQLKVSGIWHMPNEEYPAEGYYHGYYSSDEVAKGVVAVDLIAGWAHFTIGAFAPEKSATLSFYNAGGLVATAQAEFGKGIGYFNKGINFKALPYKNASGEAMGSDFKLPDGVYTVTIEKPSHVLVTLENLTFSNGDCLKLLGTNIEIPCGDMPEPEEGVEESGKKWRGDGYVKQSDRTFLRSHLNEGDTDAGDPNKTAYYADLDGDGRVTQADLEILMAAGNYNEGPVTRSY